MNDVWWSTNYEYYLPAMLLFVNYQVAWNAADYFAQVINL